MINPAKAGAIAHPPNRTRWVTPDEGALLWPHNRHNVGLPRWYIHLDHQLAQQVQAAATVKLGAKATATSDRLAGM
jgi:hypothetical protein